MGAGRYQVTACALRAWAAPRRSPVNQGRSLWAFGRQDLGLNLGDPLVAACSG